MGHVLDDHVQEKIRLAYAGSALRKALASQEGEVGAIARSLVGALAQQVLNAQFSQQEEREADVYGAALLQQRGIHRGHAVSALRKLGSGSGYSLLASHPAPLERAERIRAMESVTMPEQDKAPLWRRAWQWAVSAWPF
jgi:putative metalloprotease